MQLTFDPDVEAFRAEFAAFLDENLPPASETLERPRSVSHMPPVGASLAAAAVRQRLAAARAAPGIRRTQRNGGSAVRPSRGIVPPADLPQLQPAGCEYRCGIAVVIRQRRAETTLGGADPAGRDHRVAGDERAQRRFRPGVAAYPRGPLLRFARRPLRGQRPEGVDLRSPRRRCAVDLCADRSGCAKTQGHQRISDPDRYPWRGAPAVPVHLLRR